ncbi:MAG TPA: 3D domain-containing protein [Chloroflexota bacterium]|nr:3D domain-containing protein [Chloroflexota bacterium]
MRLAALALTLGSLLLAAHPTLTLAASETSTASTPTSSETGVVAFAPNASNQPSSGPSERWVAPHVETSLWSEAGPQAEEVGGAHRWAPLRVLGEAKNGRLPVHDSSGGRRGWVRAADVGPVDPALAGGADVPPIGPPIAWSGPARVTMYSCLELGGCAPTASGLWPEPGVVAVDPTVIPLGSTVWIQGLGTFLAADTGSLVRGAHLDVYGWSYQEAIAWGVQERAVLVFAPR